MKNELGGNDGKICQIHQKTYSYLIDTGSEDKNAKGTKKCVIKRKLKFEVYENWLEASQLKNKMNYLEKNDGITYIVLKKIINNS